MFVLNNSSETQTSLLVGEIEGIKICNNLVALVYTPSNLHLEAGSAPATAFGSGISSGESDEPGIKFSCSAWIFFSSAHLHPAAKASVCREDQMISVDKGISQEKVTASPGHHGNVRTGI